MYELLDCYTDTVLVGSEPVSDLPDLVAGTGLVLGSRVVVLLLSAPFTQLALLSGDPGD